MQGGEEAAEDVAAVAEVSIVGTAKAVKVTRSVTAKNLLLFRKHPRGPADSRHRQVELRRQGAGNFLVNTFAQKGKIDTAI